MSETTRNNNESSSTVNADGNEGHITDINIDRIVAKTQLKEDLATKIENLLKEYDSIKGGLEEADNELAVYKEMAATSERIMSLEDILKQVNKTLTDLADDFREGRYFAKTAEIFLPDKSINITRADFEGAAAKMLRPVGSKTFYEDVLSSFRKNLTNLRQGKEAESVADVASTSSSDSSNEGLVSQASPDVGSKRPNKVASCTSQGAGSSLDLVQNVIPGAKGHRGHQVPDASTCSPWWPLVCLWAIGEFPELTLVFDEIEAKKDLPDEQKKLKEGVLDELVKLATGSDGGSKGMRSVHRNILYVPQSHEDYYDSSYNWIIVPIMSLEDIHVWQGGIYDVAIIVGEQGDGMPHKPGEDKYNGFLDGPCKYSAIEAEKHLVAKMPTNAIDICNTEDIKKVTNLMNDFLKAFADLQTRTLNPNGTRKDNNSPREWGVTDLVEAVEKALTRESGRNSAKAPKSSDDAGAPKLSNYGSTQATKKKKKDTKQTILSQSKKGMEDLAGRLLNESLPVLDVPDTCVFQGKHILKAKITQVPAPEPMFVGAKGTLNLARQRGFRFLPSCLVAKEESSCSGEGNSDAVPPNFEGLEIAVVTPESVPPDWQLTSDSEAECDDMSEVSFDGI